ncbi:rho GDP-dissociation inhibitor 1-like [Canna indica]|uniref:Rho GDP-dissociation inhibitor 1-like n=1 Tax=Canna indica TaxID=4628 RepID=A0AAQ3Q3C0_9LILI|nr:rho GDP-dissociation inhibitor 1-like [Canna indica]
MSCSCVVVNNTVLLLPPHVSLHLANLAFHRKAQPPETNKLSPCPSHQVQVEWAMSISIGAPSGSKSAAFSSCQDMDRNEGEMEKLNDHSEPTSDTEDKITRKFSCASLSSLDGDDDNEKTAVVLGPPVPLKEQLEMDKDDESLRKWKEQLLGNVDLAEVGESHDPEVKVLNLTIVSPGRQDLVLPLPFVADDKGYAFALKDGSPYRLKFTFTVSNNIVSGLRYTNTVWKTGVKVDSTKVMLGTFSPQKEPYIYELEEDTTPAGYFARGSYSARTKFVDDDGKCYLDMSYYFEIRKEWPTPS